MNMSELHNLDDLQARVENAVRFFFDQQRCIIRGEQINASTGVQILTQNITRGNSSEESCGINVSEENIRYADYIIYHAIFFFFILIIFAGIFITKKRYDQIRKTKNRITADYIENDSQKALLPPEIAPDEDQPLVPKANDFKPLILSGNETIRDTLWKPYEDMDKQLVSAVINDSEKEHFVPERNDVNEEQNNLEEKTSDHPSSESPNKEDEVLAVENIGNETENSPREQHLEAGEAEMNVTDHGLNKNELVEHQNALKDGAQPICETAHDGSKNEEKKVVLVENSKNSDKTVKIVDISRAKKPKNKKKKGKR